MLKVGELVAFLKLDRSGFEDDIKKSESRFGGMAKGMGKVAMAGGALAVTAIAGATVKGLSEFSTLERGMNEVFTLLPGITDQAMGEMTDDVRNLATEMGVLPDDAVPALYSALSAGVPQDTVFDFLETANKAAVGGVTDLNTAVDGITSVVNAYGEDVVGAAKASDLMFTAVRLGKTNFEELSASLFNVLPTASALGVGFEDITGAMAEMTAQGVPTSVATTQMRQLLVELSKDGGKASDAFKEVAGVGLKEFMDQGGNMADVLDIMSQAAEDNGVALQDMFGSTEAGSAALALAADGTDSFRETLDEMADSAGATEGAFDQMDRGLGRSMDKLKAQASVLLGELGERVAPAIEQLVGFVQQHMPTILDVVGRVFDGVGFFVNNVLLPAFQAIQQWWSNNGEAILEHIRAFGETMQTVVDWVVGLVQTVLAWFNTGGTGITESTSEWSEFVMGVWEQVSDIIALAAEYIQTVVDIALRAITAFWNTHGERILGLVERVWGHIQTIITAVLNIIKGLFDVVLGVLTGDWSRAWNGIKAIFQNVWKLIVSILKGAWDIVRNVIAILWSGIRAAFTAGATWLANTIRNIGTRMKDGFRSAIQSVLQFFRELPGNIMKAIGNIGSLLVNVGRDLIRGLIDGIKNMFGGVKDTLGGLTKSLVSWKGPKRVDLQLLQGPAKDIMGGFASSLRQEAERSVRPALADVTAGISVGMPEMGGRSGGSGDSSSRVMEALLRELRMSDRTIKVEGDTADAESTGRSIARRLAWEARV